MQQQQGARPLPFRFLDLPIEVRYVVYNAILCSPPPPNLRRLEQQDLWELPLDFAYIRHPPETQILLVNRQIHAEAIDSMLRGNQFIRIRATGAGNVIRDLVSHSQIPIIRTTAAWRARFEGFVMTHTVQWRESAPRPLTDTEVDVDTDLVIVRRDLDAFCNILALGSVLLAREYEVHSRHVLTIHNPFQNTLSPDFMSERNLERLLRPYRDHLRGFTCLSVGGCVPSEVARSVETEVAEAHPLNFEEIIQTFRRKKDVGNGYFRRREFHKAAEAYAAGCNQVLFLRNSSLWAKAKAAGGPDFLHALTETLYQVYLNRAQNILAWMREATNPDPAMTTKLGLQAQFCVDYATRAWETFETDWRPSLPQMSKASFRMASVQRAMGHLDRAKAHIDTARQQAPSDPVIRREAEEIEALLREKTGLGRLLL